MYDDQGRSALRRRAVVREPTPTVLAYRSHALDPESGGGEAPYAAVRSRRLQKHSKATSLLGPE